MISLFGNDPQQKREELKTYFNDTFEQYERLFYYLNSDEAYYYRTHNKLRHPLIFYFGHTAVFFINKLLIAKAIDKRVDSKLESIFAVGVDEMSWDDLDEKHYEWPSVKQTLEYRKKIKDIVNDLIESMDLALPIDWQSPFWAILMGIEHERIHLETSSVLIRELPIEFLKEGAWQVCEEEGIKIKNELLKVQGGKISIGKKRDDDYYGWDNEYGSHDVEIPDFFASKYLVTNGEFLEFVNDGGYEKNRFWEEEGLAWKKFAKVKYPHFWEKEQNGYRLRFINKTLPLLLNHPVEVNYHEAKAYCNWLSEKKGEELRLPTEDEWYALAKHCNIPRIYDDTKANINLAHFISSTPVNMFKHGDFFDVVGNVWQWTQTPIYPFDGFEVHPWYDDFTTPTFDSKHNLIKGGSFISTANEILLSSRYAFRRHFYQHAGFRYVKSSYKESIASNNYENDTQISQYLEFGWGDDYFNIKNYPATCAKICFGHLKRGQRKRALDIGCATGRSTFELARKFDEVTGVDFSARFISLGTKLSQDKRVRYKIVTEGELFEYKEIDIKNYGFQNEAKKVKFWQGDACNLKPVFSGYDLIFAGNLLDRLYNPVGFLKDVDKRLNHDGLLVLSSPYSWSEEFTPRDKWIGGFKKDGENYTTIEGLKDILNDRFELIDTRDIEFVIRESGRKFQHSVAQMSIWRLR